MEVHFSGTLSKEDYMKAIKLHFKSRSIPISLGILFIVLIAFATIIDSYFRQKFAPWFLLLISACMLHLIFRRYQVQKFWSQCKAIKEPLTGVASDKGIQLSNENRNINLTWDYFIKYKVSPNFVILYQADNLISVCSRSFFEKDSDWEAFVEIVKANVPSK